jgi:putative ABC transport system permease protein
MRLSNILYLYRIRLRHRLVQELLALVGIAVGVALVFASLVANTSLTVSMEHLTRGVVGDMPLQLASRSEHGMDERLLAKARGLPGVQAAVPILETRAVLVGPRGRSSVELVGGDPRFAREGGSLLRAFTSDRLARQAAVGLPEPIVHATGVVLGGAVRVITGAGVTTSTLAARLGEEDIGDLVHSPVAIAPLPYVQRLTGATGRISRIFVRPVPGHEDQAERGLQRLAGDRLDVLPATADVDAFRLAAMPTRQSTGLFSALAALVGFLFAVSAVLLTIPHRRRFIHDLRIAGFSPAEVVQIMLADALILGLAASALGLAIGDQLSRHLFDDVPGYLTYAFPIGSQRAVSWSSLAIAIGAGLLSACVAVFAPLREIFSRDALAGIAPSAGSGVATLWQIGVGAACLAGAALVLALAPSAAIAGMLLLVAAMLLLLSTLVSLAVEGLAWLGQWVRSAVPAIAVMELRSRSARTRTLALAATAAVAVFGTVAIGGAHRDLERGLNASAEEIDRNAEVWATFPGATNASATTSFTLRDAELRSLRSLPGVESVEAYRGAFLDLGARRLWVLAPPATAAEPIPPRQVVDGDVRDASARLRSGGWIAVSESVAADHDVGVGDVLKLATPVLTTFRVAAVTTNLGWPPGAIVLNAADFARAWGTTRPAALHVGVQPGVSQAAVKRALAASLGPAHPLTLETTAERQARHYAGTRDALSRLTQISSLVLGAAVLAIAAAMGGTLWQRRVTLAGLKVDGFTQAELWRAVLLESAALLSTACLIGALFGLGGQALMSRALAVVTGFPVFYAVGVDVAIAILAGVTLLTVGMIALPGYLAVRVRPAPGV